MQRHDRILKHSVNSDSFFCWSVLGTERAVPFSWRLVTVWRTPMARLSGIQRIHTCIIWVTSWSWGCHVTWFCYQLIAKPGNKTAAPSWPDPYTTSITHTGPVRRSLDFFRCYSKQAVEQTVDLPVIWDTMVPMCCSDIHWNNNMALTLVEYKGQDTLMAIRIEMYTHRCACANLRLCTGAKLLYNNRVFFDLRAIGIYIMLRSDVISYVLICRKKYNETSENPNYFFLQIHLTVSKQVVRTICGPRWNLVIL